ncbi:MAG TPA: hypothetical protein VM305_01560 [Candidatus Limnocylindrales bacterium]|nr:hypothetical protein [Candidatus Limnocylindrales bacterium]
MGRFHTYPYRLLPSERIHVWAGYQQVRTRLMKLIESARTDRIGLYQLAALHGELGTGKSHAMRYLLNLILDQQKDDYQSIATYLPRLAVAARTDFLALYRALLRQMKSQLTTAAQNLVAALDSAADAKRSGLGEQVGEEAEINRRIRSSIIAEMGGDDAAILSAYLGLASGDGSDSFSLLAGETRSNDLRVDSDFEAVRTLAALVRFSTSPVFGLPAPAKCVYIFVDEYEVIADFSNANAISVSNGIRDLVNAAPEALCILLGFTGDAARLEALVDESVIARMTSDPIELQPLDDDEALAFIREIHEAYRLDGTSLDADFPFTEASLRELIARTSDRTPRQLLRNCRTVFEGAITAGVFDGATPLGEEDVREYLM